MASLVFVLSGQDPISQKAKSFLKDMESAGFELDLINSEQESLAREAEVSISEWIRLR